MDEKQTEVQEQAVKSQTPAGVDLAALIALVEARIVENLAQMIERMAGKNGS
jgi:hypothetical protein